MLAADAPEVLDKTVLGLPRRHVQHLGRAVDLDPCPAEVVGQYENSSSRTATQVVDLGPLRIAGDHELPLGRDAAGDRRQLWRVVGPGCDQDHLMPGTSELE